MSKKTEIEVGGRKLTVSNLDKVLYPEVGFTKQQVIDYYIRIAPVLLPHLKDRPITLKRYPDGVEGFFFYEKQCPSHRPQWVKTATVAAERRESKKIDYCVMNDLPALVWAANIADLELHTFLHRAPAITCTLSCIARRRLPSRPPWHSISIRVHPRTSCSAARSAYG
jgi:bifunctional non-homologous end joining protein LigD